jgi:hypothetical protein
MNPNLRDRILRKLESLSDERAYQVLDYVEFIESKYAERQNPPPNVFQRFAETVEDRLRAGRVSAATISEAMGLMNRAVSVLNGVAAAGKSVANDIVTAARPATPPTTGAPPAGAPMSTPPGSPQPAPQAPGPQPPAPQPAAAPPTGAQPAAPPSASSPAAGIGSASTSAGSTPSAPPAPPSQPSGEQPT